MPLLSSPRPGVSLAPPLPVNNTVLNAAGIALRRGQFSLVAAAPGVGKTLFATNLCLRTAVPSVYFSADSDEWTVRQRACSILAGTPLTAVEQQLGDEGWDSYYLAALRASDHVDWCYQTDIDVDFIVARLFAHTEMRGEYPQLLVVDNIGNAVVDQDNEGSELRATCRELQRIARATNAHVMALHHVKGVKESGDKPIWLGDLLYNLGKIPEVVLGLHREAGGVCLTVPKQRGGKAGMTLQLGIDYTTATVRGFAA
jgi:replicative DNA helicase